MEKIRIFIADDDADWREKLCDYLDGNHNFEVIGTAEDGEEACSKLKEFEPDILILDICMPYLDGLEVLKRLANESQKAAGSYCYNGYRAEQAYTNRHSLRRNVLYAKANRAFGTHRTHCAVYR